MDTQIPFPKFFVPKQNNSFNGRGKHVIHFTTTVVNAT